MTKKISFGNNPRINAPKAEKLADEWVANGNVQTGVAELIETTRFTIDIPTELHRKIKSYCALKGVKMKEEIQGLLENHFTD